MEISTIDVKIPQEVRIPMTPYNSSNPEVRRRGGSKNNILLTGRQLQEIIKIYNRPNEDGLVMKVKHVADKMKLPTGSVQLAVKLLKESGAKIESSTKDQHYKDAIKQLRLDNPDLFHKISPKVLTKK